MRLSAPVGLAASGWQRCWPQPSEVVMHGLTTTVSYTRLYPLTFTCDCVTQFFVQMKSLSSQADPLSRACEDVAGNLSDGLGRHGALSPKLTLPSGGRFRFDELRPALKARSQVLFENNCRLVSTRGTVLLPRAVCVWWLSEART